MNVNGPLVVALTNKLLGLVRQVTRAGEPPLVAHHLPAKDFLMLEREIRQDPRWPGHHGYMVVPRLEIHGIRVMPFDVLPPDPDQSMETTEQYEARISHSRYADFLRERAGWTTSREEAFRQAYEGTFRNTGRTWTR